MNKRLTPNCLVVADPLLLMERLPSSLFDLIYLSPPWNQVAYSFEPEYEIQISKFIQQSHRLLRDTGNLIIHSVGNQNGFFHSKTKEFLGDANFLEEFVIPINTGFRKQHETLIVYRRSDRSYFNKKIRRLSERELKEKFPLEDERGQFQKRSLFQPIGRVNLQYCWKGIKPDGDRSWRYSQERMDELFNQGLIVIDNLKVFEKRYLTDRDIFDVIPTVWNDLEPSPEDRKYRFTIPLAAFERLIEYSTRDNDLILAPICYAGRILDACRKLNRKWIAGNEASEATDQLIQRLWDTGDDFNLINTSELHDLPVVWNAYTIQKHHKDIIISSLISKGEGETIEFKGSACWSEYKGQKDDNMVTKVLEAIASFMNSPIGGKVLIGVSDNGKIVGIEKDIQVADKRKKNHDSYLLFLNDSIHNRIGKAAIGKYIIYFHRQEDKEICIIEVNHSPEPVFFQGDFFIRNGNQTRKLSPEETYNFLRKRTEIE